MIRVSSDSDKQIKSETKRIHRVPTCSVSKAKLWLFLVKVWDSKFLCQFDLECNYTNLINSWPLQSNKAYPFACQPLHHIGVTCCNVNDICMKQIGFSELRFYTRVLHTWIFSMDCTHLRIDHFDSHIYRDLSFSGITITL